MLIIIVITQSSVIYKHIRKNEILGYSLKNIERDLKYKHRTQI